MLVLVFTLQGYDLRTFHGRIDLQHGTYKDCPKIVEAQWELYRRLNADQLVWLQQERPAYLGSATGQFLHEIDLDDRDIVTVVDGFVWNHIIGNHRFIPEEDHEAIRRSILGSVRNGVSREDVLRRAEDEYLAKHLPRDLWAALTKQSIEKPWDQPLARFPLTYSQIRDVQQLP
jgi:hypothetical protein